jgi:hypothetical protein
MGKPLGELRDTMLIEPLTLILSMVCSERIEGRKDPIQLRIDQSIYLLAHYLNGRKDPGRKMLLISRPGSHKPAIIETQFS